MRQALTTAFCERVKATEGKQVTYFDTKTTGFALRVSPGFTRTFLVAYRFDGRMRWLKLGVFPNLALAAARDLAKQKLGEVAKGIDPAAVKQEQRESESFNELAERYLDQHARAKKKPSSVKEDEKILKRDLLPAWGARKATSISKRDVIALVHQVAARGARVGAIRTLALASKIFNFAVSKDVLAMNPAYRVAKPSIERPRERVLSDAEIRLLWQTLEALESQTIADAYRLMLLTAQREGEVLRMTWSEIDFDNAWWVIPAERSKVHQAHRVPLTASALEILQRRRDTQKKGAKAQPPSLFVFPGRRSGQPLGYIGKRHAAIKRTLAFDVQPRDLRRTAGTWIASTGVGRFVVARLLGHADRAITSVYDRYSYDSEKRAALDKWDERLKLIVSGKYQRAKVIGEIKPDAAHVA